MLRFCLMSIIQHELDEMKKIWTTHHIREVRNSECPPDQPNVLYSLPEQFGGRNCSFPINMKDVEVCNAFIEQPSITDYTDHSHKLARLLMYESALELPTRGTEAKGYCNLNSKYWDNAWLKHNYSQLPLSRIARDRIQGSK